VEQAARLILGLIAAVLVLQLIQHGPAGPTRWLRAKFLGDT
jgi:uncharacterized membrane protein